MESENDLSQVPNDSGCMQDEPSACKSEMEQSPCQSETERRCVELLDLSDDVLLWILQFCDARDLKALGFSCRRLGLLVCDRSLWGRVLSRSHSCGPARLRWYLSLAHDQTSALAVVGHVRSVRKQAPEPTTYNCHNCGNDMAPSTIPRCPVHGYKEFLGLPDENGVQYTVMDHCSNCGFAHKKPEPTPKPEEPVIEPIFTATPSLLRQMSARCPKLHTLELTYCNVDWSMISMAQFPPTLQRLSLRGCKSFKLPADKSCMFRIHQHLPLLEELDLSSFDGVEGVTLLPISKLSRLRRLRMRNCKRLHEFVAYASLSARYGFRQLQMLDVRGSTFSDSEISAFGWLPQLEELYISAEHPEPDNFADEHLIDRELEDWELEEPSYYRSRRLPSPEPASPPRPQPFSQSSFFTVSVGRNRPNRRRLDVHMGFDDGADGNDDGADGNPNGADGNANGAARNADGADRIANVAAGNANADRPPVENARNCIHRNIRGREVIFFVGGNPGEGPLPGNMAGDGNVIIVVGGMNRNPNGEEPNANDVINDLVAHGMRGDEAAGNGAGGNANGAGRNANGADGNAAGARANDAGGNAVDPGVNAVGAGVNAVGPGVNAVDAGVNAVGAAGNANGADRNANGADGNAAGAGAKAAGSYGNADVAERNAVGAGVNAVGPGGNANGAGSNADGAGWNADGVGANAAGACGNADVTERNAVGAGVNAVGAVGNAYGSGRNADGAECNVDGAGGIAIGAERNGEGRNAAGDCGNGNGAGGNVDGAGGIANGAERHAADGNVVSAEINSVSADSNAEGADGKVPANCDVDVSDTTKGAVGNANVPIGTGNGAGVNSDGASGKAANANDTSEGDDLENGNSDMPPKKRIRLRVGRSPSRQSIESPKHCSSNAAENGAQRNAYGANMNAEGAKGTGGDANGKDDGAVENATSSKDNADRASGNTSGANENVDSPMPSASSVNENNPGASGSNAGKQINSSNDSSDDDNLEDGSGDGPVRKKIRLTVGRSPTGPSNESSLDSSSNASIDNNAGSSINTGSSNDAGPSSANDGQPANLENRPRRYVKFRRNLPPVVVMEDDNANANQNQAAPNQNQAAPNQNQAAPNQNQAAPNQNQAAPNQNQAEPNVNPEAQNRGHFNHYRFDLDEEPMRRRRIQIDRPVPVPGPVHYNRFFIQIENELLNQEQQPLQRNEYRIPIARHARRIPGLPALLASRNYHMPIHPNLLISDATLKKFGHSDDEDEHVVRIDNLGVLLGGHSDRPNKSKLKKLVCTGYVRVTNASLTHLVTAAPELAYVDMRGTRVTEEGVNAFKALRPTCEVLYDEGRR